MVMSKREGKESHHCFAGQSSLEHNIHIDLTPIALRERWRLWGVRDVILSQLLVKVNKWFPKAQANTFSIRFRHHKIYFTDLKIITKSLFRPVSHSTFLQGPLTSNYIKWIFSR